MASLPAIPLSPREAVFPFRVTLPARISASAALLEATPALARIFCTLSGWFSDVTHVLLELPGEAPLYLLDGRFIRCELLKGGHVVQAAEPEPLEEAVGGAVQRGVARGATPADGLDQPAVLESLHDSLGLDATDLGDNASRDRLQVGDYRHRLERGPGEPRVDLRPDEPRYVGGRIRRRVEAEPAGHLAYHQPGVLRGVGVVEPVQDLSDGALVEPGYLHDHPRAQRLRGDEEQRLDHAHLVRVRRRGHRRRALCFRAGSLDHVLALPVKRHCCPPPAC